MSDSKRVYNFNPGPAALPYEVLQQAQVEMLDYKGTGMSVMEISHRSKEFESIIQTAEADLRELLGIPANYKVMFLQGGASLQFAMLPMNLRATGSADYIVTGTWSKTAFKEAQKLGTTHAAANTEAEGFKSLPAKLDLDPKAAVSALHIQRNNSWRGIFQGAGSACRSSAGVRLVIGLHQPSRGCFQICIDLCRRAEECRTVGRGHRDRGVTICSSGTPANLPVMLDYKALAASGSLHNTPPCYAIYITGLVLKWAKGLGGLEAIAKRNHAKADLVYKAIDESGGFYRGHANKDARSMMNIPFRLPSEELEDTFAKESKKNDLIGLKGHRSVGGMRASLYNALDVKAAEELTRFMRDFQKKHG